MNLYIPDTSEIVRSGWRDAEHLTQLNESSSGSLKELVGDRSFISMSKWIDVFVKASYFTSTTVAGMQTLGEEYLGLVQMDGEEPRYVASDLRRACAVFIETFDAVIVKRFFEYIRSCGQDLQHRNRIHPGLYRLTQDLPQLTTSFMQSMRAFNIALFYLFGTPFYDISKALTNIQYRSIRPQSNLPSKKLYTFLGFATILKLVLSCKRQLNHYDLLSDPVGDVVVEEASHSSDTTRIECALCCEETLPVATPCGHVFCWSCIERSRNQDSGVLQCPSCRYQYESSRSIPLMNV